MDATEHFLRIPLFSDLSQEEIIDVLRIARVVSFPTGAALCRRGERADCAFVIEQGEAEVTGENEKGKTIVLARVGAGEVVGELALIDGQPRSADVIARTQIRGYRIDRSELDALRRALHPAVFKITRRIAITISDRLRDVNDVIAKELTKTGTIKDDPGRSSRAALRVSRDQQRSSLTGVAPVRASSTGMPPVRMSSTGTAPVEKAGGAKATAKAAAGKAPARGASKPHDKPTEKPAEKADDKAAGGGFWRSMVDRLSGGRGE